MIRITLDEKESDEANEILGRLADRAENISGGLGNVGEALLQTTRDRFESESAPDGSSWKPLQLTTIMMRGGGGHILNVSGNLKNSLSYNVSGNVLQLGPNTPYAAAHQFGSTHEIRAKNKTALAVPWIGPHGLGVKYLKAVIVSIPARPYIGFGPKDQEAAREAVEEWLEVEKL